MKITAVAMVVVFVGLSAVFVYSWLFRGIVVGAGVIGVVTIVFRVPTRERVLEAGLAGAEPSV